MHNSEKSVFLTPVQILHDDFFTQERSDDWKDFMGRCCLRICENFKSNIDVVSGVEYFLSISILDEVVGDAVIGMNAIVNKTPHHIEAPNAFKIAAYLSYWFVRNKPIIFLYPNGTDLDSIVIANGKKIDKNMLVWQIKHVNEIVAVDIATTLIFDFNNVVCKKSDCKRVAKNNIVKIKNELGIKLIDKRFDFSDFDELRKVITKKLTYFFTYRVITPKIIEHILEGYAFHPAWRLTGAHWSTKET